MDINDVRQSLINVLRVIQEDGGYPDVEITERTCPVLDLEGFDSKLWPVSISMLSDELEIEIPLDMNIYFSPDGKRRLTVGEIATRVATIAPKGGAA